MALFQQLKTLPLFLSYLLHAVDEHSLQAPYAFEFYTRLKATKKQSALDPDIEYARDRYLKTHERIFGQDMGAGTRMASVSKGKKISAITRHGISSTGDCKFINSLIELCPPTVCVELGTALGISTAYLAKSTHFQKVYSFEGNEVQVKLARGLLTSLDCKNYEIIEGNIDDRLPEALQNLESIGFALVDANHTSAALLRYFDLLVNHMSPNGIMLIDDIRWSKDMYKGWKKLVLRQEISLSLEYAQKGILFFKEGISKQHYVVSG